MSTETTISDIESTHEFGLVAVTHAAMSDVGRRREENQDSWGVIEGEDFRFFIVADGMGGVKGGAIASSTAIEVVSEKLSRQLKVDIPSIVEAVNQANTEVFEKGLEDTCLSGMGTTFVGLCFSPKGLFVVNVGDSRAYRLRDGQIVQLTEDHTLVTELLRSGAISSDQVENHPISHMLTRSLGPTPAIDIDCWLNREIPRAADKYLLCSDGLYNLVSDDEMAVYMDNYSLEEAVEKLVALANERGGTDNITVIVVKVERDFVIEEEDPTAMSADFLRSKDTLELSEGVVTELTGKKSGNSKTTEIVEPEPEDAEPEENAEDTETAEQEEELLEEAEEVEVADEEEGTATTGSGEKDQDGQAIAGSPDLMDRLSARVVDQSEGEVGAAEQTKVEDTARISVLKEDSFIANERQKSGVDSKYVWFSLFFAATAVVFSFLWYSDDQEFFIPENTRSFVMDLDSPELAGSLDTPLDQELPKLKSKTDKKVTSESKRAESQTSTKASSTSEQEPELLPGTGTSTAQIGQEPHGLGKDELGKIQARQKELQTTIAGLNKKLEAFDRPLSGEFGMLLGKASSDKEKLEKTKSELQARMKYSTRRLAVWYGRKKKLQSVGELKLLTEVAATSDMVRKRQSEFEAVTYHYLKENDVLSFNPDDEKQKVKVGELLKERKKQLKLLKQTVREAIEAELRDSDHLISELTLRRDQLEEEIQEKQLEIQFAKILIGQDKQAKAKLKADLKQRKRLAETELKELNELVPPKNAPAAESKKDSQKSKAKEKAKGSRATPAKKAVKKTPKKVQVKKTAKKEKKAETKKKIQKKKEVPTKQYVEKKTQKKSEKKTEEKAQKKTQ